MNKRNTRILSIMQRDNVQLIYINMTSYSPLVHCVSPLSFNHKPAER